VLGDAKLESEDIVDLEKLRLDLVCTVQVGGSQSGALHYAHLNLGEAEQKGYIEEQARSIHDLDLDFAALIAALEKEAGRQKVIQKAEGQLRALVVGVYRDRRLSQWRLAEIVELANTAGVHVLDTIIQMKRKVDPRFVVGKGKLEEVELRCLNEEVEFIIFDHDLMPAQARAIAAATDLKVIDRTQLILDIFAQRAQSADGKLQVELAQLKYNLPRLTDLDAGLSRLTGGIGGRGPGETKLEINRRRARDRISRLEKEIDKLSKGRGMRRSRRQESEIPIISIIGYTNAGKSTLLNMLTQSKVFAEDKLFATLDPTSRRLRFPLEREAIITDTVGFIRDLPPDLLRAFRATLEELEGADLLLHVLDISDPMVKQKQETVDALLEELQLSRIPQLIVYNKSDLVDPDLIKLTRQSTDTFCVSALQKTGLRELVKGVGHYLWPEEEPIYLPGETAADEDLAADPSEPISA
jgi:GTP-binding protein HflX